MKKVLILLLFVTNVCLAQEDIFNDPPPDFTKERARKRDVRYQLTSLIIANAKNRSALIEGPHNYAYFFSITLSFDNSGKVEEVYFSKNRPPLVTDLLSLNVNLVKKIKEANIEYKQYASKLVLIPFFYYRMDAKVLDYKSGFLRSIENILPVVDYKNSKKSWVILDTMVNPFHSIQ